MPRYFIYLRDGKCFPDDEGLELPDLETARQEAVRSAREIMAEEVKQGRMPLRDRVEIKDERGENVMTVAFVETVEIDLGQAALRVNLVSAGEDVANDDDPSAA